MKIRYRKKRLNYGDYQAERLIWIRTLKDELLIKLNVIDGKGNLLYRVIEPPESPDYKIEREHLTFEQLENIKALYFLNVPDAAIEDETDIDYMLGDFGHGLGRRHWLERDSKKDEDVIVDFVFHSTSGDMDYGTFDIEYLDQGTTDDEAIERFLLPKLIEEKHCNAVEANIARSGTVNSYEVVIEEVQDLD